MAPPSDRPAADAFSGDDAGSAPAADRRRRRPVWRRGSFWFAVIVAEAAVALVISIVLAPGPDEIPLAGADQSVWCADVAAYRSAAVDQLPLTVESAPAAFEAQAAAYRRWRDQAPAAIRDDLTELAEMTDLLVADANRFAQQAAADPAVDGAVLLARRQGEVTGMVAVPAERVRAATRQACGVDLGVAPAAPPVSDPPETTAPATTTTGG